MTSYEQILIIFVQPMSIVIDVLIFSVWDISSGPVFGEAR
jgi:hypothetical protein